jgi:hypothetical protein
MLDLRSVRRTIALGLPLLALCAVTAAPASSAPGAKETGKEKEGSKDKAAEPDGKLNREEFEAALKPVLGDFHGCYDRALKRDAVAEGTVILVLETRGGKILKAETDREPSTLKLEEAHKCIAVAAKKIKMPLAKNSEGKHDPKARAVIRYPLEFSLGIDVGSGIAKATGAKLDYDKVKSVFLINKIEIGRCWLDAKKAKPLTPPIGKLVLKISTTGGKVTAVEKIGTDSTLDDPSLETCVFDSVKKFRFPIAKDAKGADDDKAASVIVYPMEFQAR